MWSEIERHALVETLLAADPLAPTLCEGWQVRHLAVHLLLRRHRPWALTGSTLATMALEIETPAQLQRTVQEFDTPIVGLSPLRLMDETFADPANLGEYVIHHEDVRRGQIQILGRAAAPPVPAREFPAPMAAALLEQSARFARMRLRRAEVGVVFEVPDGPATVVRPGPRPVTASGSPADLALLASGRARAATISWSGPSEQVQAILGD